MKRLAIALAVFASMGCFALNKFDGASNSEEGPSMPGDNSSSWAGSPEGPRAWVFKTKNARGPTGHCEDPNPRPDKEPKGVLMTGEPNGPTGPDWTYWVNLTEDHYAGPDRELG